MVETLEYIQMSTIVQLLLRRGTTSQWSSVNTVLAQGEPGFDTVLKILKIGDGVTPWNSLPISSGRGITGGTGISVNLVGSTYSISTTLVGLTFGLNAPIALGFEAGQTGQEQNAIAIGNGAGQTGQQQSSVAIGYNAGQNGQKINAVAVGILAGQYTQGSYAVALGNGAGNTGQGQSSVAIGDVAGNTVQGDNAVAIGPAAGQTGQGDNAVAIGPGAGQTVQGDNAVAIGDQAGNTGQSARSVAVGGAAGENDQGQNAVAIGWQSGFINQGDYSVAIGSFAGYDGAGLSSQAANTIILNASGNYLSGAGATGCLYVDPVRQSADPGTGYLVYDAVSKEITCQVASPTYNPTSGITYGLTFKNDTLNDPASPTYIYGSGYEYYELPISGLTVDSNVQVVPVFKGLTGFTDAKDWIRIVGTEILDEKIRFWVTEPGSGSTYSGISWNVLSF